MNNLGLWRQAVFLILVCERFLVPPSAFSSESRPKHPLVSDIGRAGDVFSPTYYGVQLGASLMTPYGTFATTSHRMLPGIFAGVRAEYGRSYVEIQPEFNFMQDGYRGSDGYHAVNYFTVPISVRLNIVRWLEFEPYIFLGPQLDIYVSSNVVTPYPFGQSLPINLSALAGAGIAFEAWLFRMNFELRVSQTVTPINVSVNSATESWSLTSIVAALGVSFDGPDRDDD